MECDAYHDFLWDGGWFGLFGGETTLPLPSFTFFGRIQAYSTCTHLGVVGRAVVPVVWVVFWLDGGKSRTVFPARAAGSMGGEEEKRIRLTSS